MKISNPHRGIWIKLDEKQIFQDDPGQGTPALVILKTGETGTWNCVMDTGEVDGVKLSDGQLAWLNQVAHMVENWLLKHRV